MGFAKGTTLGFVVGFAAAVGVSMIRVKRPRFVVNADLKSYRKQKQQESLLADAQENLEIMWAMMGGSEDSDGDFTPYLQKIRFKALTDPRWGRVLKVMLDEEPK